MIEKIRSFIAIDIEGSKTLDNIEKYQTELQKSIGPLKLVKKELMHITIKFLGDITEKIARDLYFFIENHVNSRFFYNSDNPINCVLEGVGDFRKNVFFVNISEGIEEIRKIHSVIEEKIRTFEGIKYDTKKFTPHVTIARKKKYIPKNNPGQRPYIDLKQEYQKFTFGQWTISKVVLKRSILTSKGPIYSNLKY